MKIPKKKTDSAKHCLFEKRNKPNLKIRSAKKYEKVQSSKAKPKPGKQKADFTTMSVDDFMTGNLLASDESDSENDQSKPGPSPSPRLNGKKQGKGDKATKGSSFIDFEAEEDEVGLEDDDLSASDKSEDSEDETGDVNVRSFLDDEAEEDNTFDLGDDDEDDDGDTDSGGEDNDDGDTDSGGEDNDDGDKDSGGEDNDDTNKATKDSADGQEEDELSPTKHKKSLQQLRHTDPEFYKYLEAHDKKLLQFQDSDSEDDDRDTDKFHKPDADQLEVASDESDFEAEDGGQSKQGSVTLKMVREWRAELEAGRSIEPIANAVLAFHAAMIRVTGADEACQLKVDGSSVFNAVVQMCVLDLQPAIKRFLRMPTGASADKILPQKCKKWKKVRSHLKFYLQDLLKLMGGVSSPHVVGVLLKHLHQMAPFVSCFPLIVEKVVKRLVKIWASGEETTRIVAFLCIVRLCSSQRSLLDTILKQMYLAYVSNAKFVSPNTLPGINFMRRSLVEVYRLDEVASYQHVFLYVRQLAIHLRNAMTLQKKESIQAVLNWQFVHSLHLWAALLGATANKPALQPLLYPLVQVIVGTIKLISTTQYFPLRFHCVQMLVDLSNNTNTFIPVLPFLTEVLATYDFNKRPKKASMKPMDMTCLLRVSKTEQTEKNFKDAIIEQIYRLMLQSLASEAHSIAFPDLVVAPVMQIKKFLKECKVSNYCKKIKSILDKVEENACYVEKERRNVTLNLGDRKAVDAFETNLKLKGTPLGRYCASYVKVNTQALRKTATNNDKLGEYDLPSLIRHKRKIQDDGPAVLFPSDSDSEGRDLGPTEPERPKKKKKKKLTKKVKKTTSRTERETEDQPDLVQDLRLEDF